MIIKRIEVKNFKSLGHIAIDFPSSGIFLIDGINHDVDGGSNASGKTSLVSAVPYCFFGRVLDGSNIADYVRYGEDNIFVGVELEFSKGCLLLQRTLNDFSMTLNGEVIEATKTSLTKEFCYLTGLTYQAMKALFLGQNWESFVDATPGKRVEALESIFSLFIFEEAVKEFKNNIKRFEKRQQELLVQKSYTEGILLSTKESYLSKIEEFENKRKDLLAKIEKQILDISENIKIYSAQLSELDSDINLDLLKKEIDKLEVKVSNLIAELKVYGERIKNLNTSIKNLKNKIKTIKYELEKLEDDTCPLCGQLVTDPRIKAKKKLEFDNSLKELEELKDLLNAITAEYHTKKSEYKHYQKELADRKSVYDKYFLEQLNKQEITNKLKLLMDKKEQLVKEKERLLSETNPFIALEEERKQKYDNALAKFNQVTRKLKKIGRFIEYNQEWIKITKKVRSLLFMDMLRFLIRKSNEFLHFIYPELTVDFVMKKEKLILQVLKNNEATSFKLLSGGEQQLVRLSCLLGLFESVRVRITEPINFVFLDEPFHNLDLYKREKFLNLLKELSKNLQIFVIDHSQSIGSDVDKHIVLEKRNGVSSLKELI